MRVRLPSLRAQVVTLVLALAIPAIGLEVWWSVREYRSAATQARLQALTTAERTSLSIQQFLSVTGGVMAGITREFRDDLLAPAECEGLVRVLTDMLPYFVNAAVMAPDGTVVCSAAPTPRLPDLGFPRGTSEGLPQQPVVGVPIVDPGSGGWTLPVSVPIIASEGAAARSLTGFIPLLELRDMLPAVLSDDPYLITIATSDDLRVIMRSSDMGAWIGQPLPPPTGDDLVLVGRGRMATGPDAGNVQRAWGITEIPSVGWSVFVGVPSNEVDAPAFATAMRRIGLTGIFLLIGIAFAAWSYGRIAAALRQLVESARVASRGNQISLPDGTPDEISELVVQFNRALTSRGAAEAAERIALERYASIFNEAVFGIFVATPQGRILEANPALASMLGHGEIRPVLETPLRDRFRDPDQHDIMFATCLTEGSLEDFVAEWVHSDGTTRMVRIDGKVVITDEGGEGVEMIVNDVTEELRRDVELRQTQKMQAVGRLAGGIAHDFNNLMTVISVNTELALESMTENEDARSDLLHVRGAASRATQLTRQLLAFSRGDGSEIRDVDVNRIVADLEAMLRRLLGADVRLKTRLDPALPHVRADPGRLEQVIMNLVLNARDALPSRGCIMIETTAEGPRADEPPGDRQYAGIRVRDDGVGMDDATRARIFEPFFTTKEATRGTGLGLATVYGIVEQADGRIDVTSEPGAGTTFTIWLPAAP